MWNTSVWRSTYILTLLVSWWSWPLPGLAQGVLVEEVQFKTVDHVILHGDYYPCSAARRNGCVLLLHDLGDHKPRRNRDHVAHRLQKRGFAVLAFDFRGHGRSVKVEPDFWKTPINRRLVKGAYTNPPTEEIHFRSFHRAYFPTLLNDIAAARTFLETRNDVGECNANNLLLIGVGEGATLGVLWLAAESHRYQLKLRFPPRVHPEPESEAVIGAVWLNLRPTLRGRDMEVIECLRTVSRSREFPTVFLYSESDPSAEEMARRCLRALKKEHKKLELTGHASLPGRYRRGQDLFDESLDTTQLVLDFLNQVVQRRPLHNLAAVDFKDNEYLWIDLGGKILVAKQTGEERLRMLPPEVLSYR